MSTNPSNQRTQFTIVTLLVFTSCVSVLLALMDAESRRFVSYGGLFWLVLLVARCIATQLSTLCALCIAAHSIISPILFWPHMGPEMSRDGTERLSRVAALMILDFPIAPLYILVPSGIIGLLMTLAFGAGTWAGMAWIVVSQNPERPQSAGLLKHGLFAWGLIAAVMLLGDTGAAFACCAFWSLFVYMDELHRLVTQLSAK
jgi:hypothetical protein